MRRSFPFVFWSLLCLTTALFCSGTATAQMQMTDTTLPPQSFYVAVAEFNEGHLTDALKDFQSGWRGSLKISTERWIDAICYASMSGECFFQMGQYQEALEQYTISIELFLRWANWMTFIDNKELPETGPFMKKPVPWGDAKQGRQLRKVPEKLLITFGDPNYNTRKYKSGDTIMPPSIRQIRADEIVRCTALAIRRRGDILGSLIYGDELNAKLISNLTRLRQAMQGTWMQTWVDLQLGLAYIANGKDAEGIQCLNRGALLNGAEHSLSSLVYLTLGEQAMRTANYDKALEAYLNAATLGFYFDDGSVIEEAFRGLGNAYYQKDAKQICPWLAPAEAWTKREKLGLLRVTLLSLLAEENLRKKQPDNAAAYIKEAEFVLNKHRGMQQSVPAARVQFLKANLAFLDPTPASQKVAEQALNNAMQFMQTGSIWNYRIAKVDEAFVNNRITSRKANDYYEELVHDPTVVNWTTNPMESLAMLMTPRDFTWENWFAAMMDLNRPERALEIAEQAKRSRFLHTLSFGGRMHALRLLCEVPEEELSVTQLQRRRDIMNDHPDYAVRSKQVAKLQQRLRSMKYPLNDENSKEAQKILKEISKLASEQESILASIVMERRPIDILFPPIKSLKEIQEKLPDGETMLVFFIARGRLVAFMLNNERFINWEVRSDLGSTTEGKSTSKSRRSSRKAKASVSELVSLQSNLVAMLNELGLSGSAANIKSTVLEEETWKEHALQAMTDLTKSSKADFSKSDFSSLVVVPDGFMWYLPFDMLQIHTKKGLRPTINQFAIRYAPTASLGVPWKKKSTQANSAYTAIAFGKEAPDRALLKKLETTVGQSIELTPKDFGGVPSSCSAAVSQVYAPTFDSLLVMMDLKNSSNDPFGVTPMGVDASMVGSQLRDWFTLPYGAPRLLMLSGFHTMAENLNLKESKKKSGLKSSKSAKNSSRTSSRASSHSRSRRSKAPDVPEVPGMEMFLTSMSLMANGTDVAILSRWQMNGGSSYMLANAFAEKLETEANVAAAWRQAILKFAGMEVDLEKEPRIKVSGGNTKAKGSHPTLWGGYMLISSGMPLYELEEVEVQPAKPGDDAPAIVVPGEPNAAPADAKADDDVPALVVPGADEKEPTAKPAEAATPVAPQSAAEANPTDTVPVANPADAAPADAAPTDTNPAATKPAEAPANASETPTADASGNDTSAAPAPAKPAETSTKKPAPSVTPKSTTPSTGKKPAQAAGKAANSGK